MWRSTLISKKYPPKVTRRHIYTLRDSLDPLVKAATLLRLFSLPNGVFYLQFSNKKHYNLVLTTHLCYKKNHSAACIYLQPQLFSFIYPHLRSYFFIDIPLIYLPLLSSTIIYFHFRSLTFIHFHLPSPDIFYLHLPSSTPAFIEIYLCAFVYFHRPAFTLKYLHLFQLSIQQYSLTTIYLLFFSLSTFIDLYLLSFLFIFLCLPSAFLSYHHCPSLSFFLPSLTFIVLYLSQFTFRYNYLPSSHRFTSLSLSWL